MPERMTDAEFEAAKIELNRLRAESDRAAGVYYAANVAAGDAFFQLLIEHRAREVGRLVADNADEPAA